MHFLPAGTTRVTRSPSSWVSEMGLLLTEAQEYPAEVAGILELRQLSSCFLMTRRDLAGGGRDQIDAWTCGGRRD